VGGRDAVRAVHYYYAADQHAEAPGKALDGCFIQNLARTRGLARVARMKEETGDHERQLSTS
jgi:hypothetical protein